MTRMDPMLSTLPFIRNSTSFVDDLINAGSVLGAGSVNPWDPQYLTDEGRLSYDAKSLNFFQAVGSRITRGEQSLDDFSGSWALKSIPELVAGFVTNREDTILPVLYQDNKVFNHDKNEWLDLSTATNKDLWQSINPQYRDIFERYGINESMLLDSSGTDVASFNDKVINAVQYVTRQQSLDSYQEARPFLYWWAGAGAFTSNLVDPFIVADIASLGSTKLAKTTARTAGKMLIEAGQQAGTASTRAYIGNVLYRSAKQPLLHKINPMMLYGATGLATGITADATAQFVESAESIENLGIDLGSFDFTRSFIGAVLGGSFGAITGRSNTNKTSPASLTYYDLLSAKTGSLAQEFALRQLKTNKNNMFDEVDVRILATFDDLETKMHTIWKETANNSPRAVNAKTALLQEMEYLFDPNRSWDAPRLVDTDPVNNPNELRIVQVDANGSLSNKDIRVVKTEGDTVELLIDGNTTITKTIQQLRDDPRYLVLTNRSDENPVVQAVLAKDNKKRRILKEVYVRNYNQTEGAADQKVKVVSVNKSKTKVLVEADAQTFNTLYPNLALPKPSNKGMYKFEVEFDDLVVPEYGRGLSDSGTIDYRPSRRQVAEFLSKAPTYSEMLDFVRGKNKEGRTKAHDIKDRLDEIKNETVKLRLAEERVLEKDVDKLKAGTKVVRITNTKWFVPGKKGQVRYRGHKFTAYFVRRGYRDGERGIYVRISKKDLKNKGVHTVDVTNSNFETIFIPVNSKRNHNLSVELLPKTEAEKNLSKEFTKLELELRVIKDEFQTSGTDSSGAINRRLTRLFGSNAGVNSLVPNIHRGSLETLDGVERAKFLLNMTDEELIQNLPDYIGRMRLGLVARIGNIVSGIPFATAPLNKVDSFLVTVKKDYEKLLKLQKKTEPAREDLDQMQLLKENIRTNILVSYMVAALDSTGSYFYLQNTDGSAVRSVVEQRELFNRDLNVLKNYAERVLAPLPKDRQEAIQYAVLARRQYGHSSPEYLQALSQVRDKEDIVNELYNRFFKLVDHIGQEGLLTGYLSSKQDNFIPILLKKDLTGLQLDDLSLSYYNYVTNTIWAPSGFVFENGERVGLRMIRANSKTPLFMNMLTVDYNNLLSTWVDIQKKLIGEENARALKDALGNAKTLADEKKITIPEAEALITKEFKPKVFNTEEVNLPRTYEEVLELLGDVDISDDAKVYLRAWLKDYTQSLFGKTDSVNEIRSSFLARQSKDAINKRNNTDYATSTNNNTFNVDRFEAVPNVVLRDGKAIKLSNQTIGQTRLDHTKSRKIEQDFWFQDSVRRQGVVDYGLSSLAHNYTASIGYNVARSVSLQSIFDEYMDWDSMIIALRSMTMYEQNRKKIDFLVAVEQAASGRYLDKKDDTFNVLYEVTRNIMGSAVSAVQPILMAPEFVYAASLILGNKGQGLKQTKDMLSIVFKGFLSAKESNKRQMIELVTSYLHGYELQAHNSRMWGDELYSLDARTTNPVQKASEVVSEFARTWGGEKIGTTALKMVVAAQRSITIKRILSGLTDDTLARLLEYGDNVNSKEFKKVLRDSSFRGNLYMFNLMKKHGLISSASLQSIRNLNKINPNALNNIHDFEMTISKALTDLNKKRTQALKKKDLDLKDQIVASVDGLNDLSNKYSLLLREMTNDIIVTPTLATALVTARNPFFRAMLQFTTYQVSFFNRFVRQYSGSPIGVALGMFAAAVLGETMSLFLRDLVVTGEDWDKVMQDWDENFESKIAVSMTRVPALGLGSSITEYLSRKALGQSQGFETVLRTPMPGLTPITTVGNSLFGITNDIANGEFKFEGNTDIEKMLRITPGSNFFYVLPWLRDLITQ